MKNGRMGPGVSPGGAHPCALKRCCIRFSIAIPIASIIAAVGGVGVPDCPGCGGEGGVAICRGASRTVAAFRRTLSVVASNSLRRVCTACSIAWPKATSRGWRWAARRASRSALNAGSRVIRYAVARLTLASLAAPVIVPPAKSAPNNASRTDVLGCLILSQVSHWRAYT